MEAAAWFWSNAAKTGEGNLNAYVNKNGKVPAAFMNDLASIRQGGTFKINDDSLSVNGNTWRLPVNWSSRKDAYDKAVKVFK